MRIDVLADGKRRRARRLRAAGVLGFATAVLLLAGCGTEPPANWQWWTGDDSTAVAGELTRWQPVLDARLAFADTLRLGQSSGLLLADSASATGDTLYKFKRLLAAWMTVDAAGHSNGLTFGVTDDTVAMTDTFCHVEYVDTVMGAKFHFRYDSLWVVGFTPDTLIDTARTPPETTIVFRASYTEARGFDTPQELTKDFDWASRRFVHLAKTPGAVQYAVRRLTGLGVHVPTAQDAPGISSVTFARPGRIDTFYYSARSAPDVRGIYNLRSVDTLYTVTQGDVIDLTVSISGDSASEKERCFVGVNGAKFDITASGKRGEGSFSFSDTGYQHVYIAAVSVSGLGYVAAVPKVTFWAIPVRVTARQ
jgi:hypothetical protein